MLTHGNKLGETPSSETQGQLVGRERVELKAKKKISGRKSKEGLFTFSPTDFCFRLFLLFLAPLIAPGSPRMDWSLHLLSLARLIADRIFSRPLDYPGRDCIQSTNTTTLMKDKNIYIVV